MSVQTTVGETVDRFGHEFTTRVITDHVAYGPDEDGKVCLLVYDTSTGTMYGVLLHESIQRQLEALPAPTGLMALSLMVEAGYLTGNEPMLKVLAALTYRRSFVEWLRLWLDDALWVIGIRKIAD